MGIKISELESRGTILEQDLMPIINMDDENNPKTQKVTIQNLLNIVNDMVNESQHPVGSIYLSFDSTSPAELFRRNVGTNY